MNKQGLVRVNDFKIMTPRANYSLGLNYKTCSPRTGTGGPSALTAGITTNYDHNYDPSPHYTPPHQHHRQTEVVSQPCPVSITSCPPSRPTANFLFHLWWHFISACFPLINSILALRIITPSVTSPRQKHSDIPGTTQANERNEIRKLLCAYLGVLRCR